MRTLGMMLLAATTVVITTMIMTEEGNAQARREWSGVCTPAGYVPAAFPLSSSATRAAAPEAVTVSETRVTGDVDA